MQELREGGIIKDDPSHAAAVIVVAAREGGTSPALAIKLTVLDKTGERVLPAYFEDN